jgi:hypothetical protein
MRRLCAAVLLGIASVLGCSVGPETYTADADTGSTHALVVVERSASAASAEPKAGAVAGFVRMPASVDASEVMKLVGLGLELPALGQCAEGERGRDPTTALAPLGQVELLEAGDVQLTTAWTTASLTPRAFPTVTDLISGVVYTARDRAAEPLPSGATYDIRATGGLHVPPLTLRAEAPAALAGVAVSGTALEDLATLSTAAPLDLTWAVGSSGDVVYVELTSTDGAPSVVCAFRDELGTGTIPASMFMGSGEGRISFHRLRTQAFTRPSIDRGELRFDFELGQTVTFE